LEANCAKLNSELEALQQHLQDEVGTRDALQTVLVESRQESSKQKLTSDELAQQVEKLSEQVKKLRDQ
jgi:hypothetical protein